MMCSVLSDEPEHRLQLRLGAALEPHAVLAAEGDDLLDHVPLLVDLDRVDGGVAAGVAELANRRRERLAERLDATLEDVGEAEEHRERDALLLEVDGDLEEVERALGGVGVGAHDDVPRLVDVEEAGAPSFDVVQLLRVVDVPGRRRSGGNGGKRGSRGRRGGLAGARHGAK